MAYRSWQERRDIIRAVIADSGPLPVASFNLTQSEEIYFRARSEKAIHSLARRTSRFKAYYSLPVAKPFRNVVMASAIVIIASLAAATIYYLYTPPDRDKTSVFTGAAALIVAAAGWAVAGSITHRNTIRQNTNNLLFARFAQANFADAVHRFHRHFGFNEGIGIDEADIAALRATGNEDDWRTATSVGYLLNYFEFVANGVLVGDLDHGIVRDNFRGVICFYHDKCWPYIRRLNQQNPRVYANLVRLRTHYREP